MLRETTWRGVSPRGSDHDPRWFERVASKLDPVALQSANDPEADAEALLDDLGVKRADLFLDYYTTQGLTAALEAYGFLGKLAERGFANVRVLLARDAPDEDVRVRIVGDADGSTHLLLELRARRGRWKTSDGGVFEALMIDWLTLRDPRAPFTAARPRLPGQQVPGLGLGRDVLEMLNQSARRLKLDALVAWPDHYHNAVLYAARLRYHDPALQGRLRAIVRAATGRSLADASWAIEWGCLLDDRGKPVEWSSMRGEMALPLAEALAERFASTAYASVERAAAAACGYRFDWQAFDEKRAAARAAGEPHP